MDFGTQGGRNGIDIEQGRLVATASVRCRPELCFLILVFAIARVGYTLSPVLSKQDAAYGLW